MKKFNLFVWVILLFGSVVFSTASAFNSLYVFGDGVCTTTNNGYPIPAKAYYGKRYTNGRTWVEVLAQRQGIGISNNWSYFGQDSASLAANVSHFTAPADVANDLFVIWANDADLVGFMNNNLLNSFLSTTLPQWTNSINLALANQYKAVTNLYAKGARTLIMPNAVDISEIPQYNHLILTSKSFVRTRVNYFNANLIATVNHAKSTCPGLTIYVPDIFSLLDNVLTNAASYGLTNTLDFFGQPVDAYTYYTPLIGQTTATTNGSGTNFIFWDSTDPTAQMHEVLADYVQQIISPVQIGGLTQINGSNRIDVVNMPVGLNGFLDGSTNLAGANWTLATSFNSTATAQSIYVVTPPLPPGFGSGISGYSGYSGGPPMPGSGNTTGSNTNAAPFVSVAPQFYRLRFPYAWNWP